jgi:hypothetical protein
MPSCGTATTEGRDFGADHLEGPSSRPLLSAPVFLQCELSEEQLSSARNAGIWTNAATTTFGKLLENRRDKAVNEDLHASYEMLLFSVESEFEIAGQAVADLQVELSLNRILKTTTPGVNLTFFKDTRRVLYLHGGPSPSLQRGRPVDILVQILHGNVDSKVEEVNAISRRVGEFRAFLESLRPPPILSPIAQGQQLGVESQANAQAATTKINKCNSLQSTHRMCRI